LFFSLKENVQKLFAYFDLSVFIVVILFQIYYMCTFSHLYFFLNVSPCFFHFLLSTAESTPRVFRCHAPPVITWLVLSSSVCLSVSLSLSPSLPGIPTRPTPRRPSASWAVRTSAWTSPRATWTRRTSWSPPPPSCATRPSTRCSTASERWCRTC